MRAEVVLNEVGATDGALVLGDAEFDQFYRKTVRQLRSYLLRMTGEPATADDLSQKAFLQLLRTRLDSLEESRLRGLLYRTATNLAIDAIRKAKREREGWLGALGIRRGESTPELRHDMGVAFGRLKPRERSLLWLAHVEGFDHREIARIAGVEEGSVRVLLFRARKRLADVLRGMGLGPEVVS